jgi:hypothetical protein
VRRAPGPMPPGGNGYQPRGMRVSAVSLKRGHTGRVERWHRPGHRPRPAVPRPAAHSRSCPSTVGRPSGRGVARAVPLNRMLRRLRSGLTSCGPLVESLLRRVRQGLVGLQLASAVRLGQRGWRRDCGGGGFGRALPRGLLAGVL